MNFFDKDCYFFLNNTKLCSFPKYWLYSNIYWLGLGSCLSG